MDKVNFEDFLKLDIRVGKILEAEKVEDSNKLVKLNVSFGEEERQILAGIAKFYTSEELVGKLCPFIFNLESKKMGDLESQGMILAASNDNGEPVLLHPDKEVKPGSKVK